MLYVRRVPESGGHLCHCEASRQFPAVSSSNVDKPSQDSLPCELSYSSPERSAEVIMLQRLLFTLPVEASTWVKLHHHPKKATEGAPLWEDVTKMFEGEGENRLLGGREAEQHRLGWEGKWAPEQKDLLR